MTDTNKLLEWTGERMIPEASDDVTFWEHIFRYRFALSHLRSGNVLDIACGEGYGSYAIQTLKPCDVIGVDISEAACSHARQEYGIDARAGDAYNIPVETGWANHVVSFETIEHIEDHLRFYREIRRVLSPSGTLIISSPNRDVYGHNVANEFHVSELSRDEFAQELCSQFESVLFFSQCVTSNRLFCKWSLSSRVSPWCNIKGFWRLRNLILSRAELDGPREKGGHENKKSKILNVMRTRTGVATKLLNPFEIRRENIHSRTHGKYVIALCSIPKLN